MQMLRRHQLARLNAAGWASIKARSWDAEARACIDCWAEQQLPLVITRQPESLGADHLALGLPAPQCWSRRRLALQIPATGLMFLDEFPTPAAISTLLPGLQREGWRLLAERLADAGAEPRVYGSYGWQRLTGLRYLRTRSDLDLRLQVSDAETADQVTALLNHAMPGGPRLDGELMFADGSAVAWREWQAWREGRVDRILVKRLHGVTMEAGEAWLKEPLPC